jgi:O-glycosyl hydrolase
MDKFIRKSCIFGVILLVFALIFAGCELEVKEKQKQKVNNDLYIIDQPRYETFFTDDLAANPITITVTTVQQFAGTLTYQWYQNETESNEGGTLIEGATGKEYVVPETEAGTYYYYVVITLTGDETITTTITSDPITVIISETRNIDNPNNTITINLTKYQYVRGFGGMSTPWDNAPDDNLDDFETMFNPNKLGYNISRIMIPPHSTDIDASMKAVVTNKSVWSGTYFFEKNELPVRNKNHSYYYDKVKIVNKYGGYVLASPWSPPAEWKSNNSINGGGVLRPANYEDFVEYLNRYCVIMAKNGAPIYTVSLQNEWTFSTASADYEGCEYTETTHLNWWKQAGNYLDGVKGYGGGREIPKVQAMSGESHNEIVKLNSVLNDADARSYINLMGRHIYGSGITAPAFINNAQYHPTDPKEIWMSEHNINSGEGGYANDSTWNYVWPFMNEIDYTLRLNHENAFIWWTAKRFYSMIGDATSGTTDGEILPRGYGLSHFAKFAKETGRVGVVVTGEATNVNSSSWNSDGNKTSPSTSPKISAFVTLNDDFYAKPVETRHPRWRGVGTGALPATETLNVADIKAISLVMFTPTTVTGGGGVDMKTVKIVLPEGFKIRSATAMKSNSTDKGKTKYEEVTVGTDKNNAYVNLPAGTILSVKFTK